MKKIIEGGHFYISEGFSEESRKWWQITQQLCNDFGSDAMLFIDDVHKRDNSENQVPFHIDTTGLLSDISDKCSDIINKFNHWSQENKFLLQPDHIILESEMSDYLNEVIIILSGLSKKKRYQNRDNKWGFCSNIKILDAQGTPSCVWYDLWLTYFKDKILGYTSAINVLSEDYISQQSAVNRIYQKVNPDFELQQKYY